MFVNKLDWSSPKCRSRPATGPQKNLDRSRQKLQKHKTMRYNILYSFEFLNEKLLRKSLWEFDIFIWLYHQNINDETMTWGESRLSIGKQCKQWMIYESANRIDLRKMMMEEWEHMRFSVLRTTVRFAAWCIQSRSNGIQCASIEQTIPAHTMAQ